MVTIGCHRSSELWRFWFLQVNRTWTFRISVVVRKHFSPVFSSRYGPLKGNFFLNNVYHSKSLVISLLFYVLFVDVAIHVSCDMLCYWSWSVTATTYILNSPVYHTFYENVYTVKKKTRIPFEQNKMSCLTSIKIYKNSEAP